MCRGTRLGVLAMLLAAVSAMAAEKSEHVRFETVQNSNAAVLQRLGLVPVRIPDGHHKKRLSGPEPSDAMNIPLGSQTRIHQPYSRRHGHRDSHVYVVKLPPSQPYYTLTKPHKTSQPSQKDNDGKPANSESSSPQVGFQSNGKPGKIYHWNLPLVKKISEKKKFRAQSKMDQLKKRLQERNDEFPADSKNHNEQTNDKANPASLPATFKRPVTLQGSSKNSSSLHQSNTKRYHHVSSANSLDQDDKLVKHTRNNDKRLDYPRIPEQVRASRRPDETVKKAATDEGREKPSKNNKKSYRLEDSNLYRPETRNDNERHKNDRLPLWSLSNEVHASGNTRNSLRPKKHRKKAAMSYYAPINARTGKIDPTSATNIQNNFPGNGKPKAFYVMEKSRQPIYYHPLLP